MTPQSPSYLDIEYSTENDIASRNRLYQLRKKLHAIGKFFQKETPVK